MLCCQLSWLVIASCELICVKCEEILPKQFTINMKPTKLTNAICLNHPLNFNSMTVLRRWLINNNPHDNPQLWTHCLPPVDILLQSLACNTKCKHVAKIKKSQKQSLFQGVFQPQTNQLRGRSSTICSIRHLIDNNNFTFKIVNLN